MKSNKNLYNQSILLIFIWVFFFNSLFAQNINFKVGDKLTLNDFQINQPTIISFWATWCGVCIKEIYLMDSISNVQSNISFVLVSYEKKEIVDSFLNKINLLHKHRFTFYNNHQELYSYFPHQSLPHNIWVNASGIIEAITGTEEVTGENLLKFASGVPMNGFVEKRDVLFDFRGFLNVPDSLMYFRSIFQPYQDGINIGGFRKDKIGLGYPNMKHFYGFNVGRLSLIWNAMTGLNIINPYLLELRTEDSTKFFWPEEVPHSFLKSKYSSLQHWKKENLFYYQIYFPEPVPDSVYFNFVERDLEYNLKVKISTIIKTKLVRTVTQYNSENIYFHSYNSSRPHKIQLKDNNLVISNASLEYFLKWINENSFLNESNKSTGYIPYYNDTGYTHFSCNIILPNIENSDFKYLSREQWEKILNDQIGLVFSYSLKDYPILLIEDVKDQL